MSIPLVLEHTPACRFVIAGAGSAEAELRALVRSLKVGRSVSWLGEIAHPAAVLSDAHVYVSPSANEGFGLAVAEAMSWALPIVGRTTGGVAELVDHNATGLLVAEDDPAELASAIVRLVEDPALAERLGREAPSASPERGSTRSAPRTCLATVRTTRVMRVLRLFHSAVVPEFLERERLLRTRHGWDVHVACPPAWSEGGSIVTASHDAEVPIHVLPIHGRRHPILFWYSQRRLRALMRDLQPDIVDIHEEPYSLAAAGIVRAAAREVPTRRS